jgi:hypothetical protein
MRLGNLNIYTFKAQIKIKKKIIHKNGETFINIKTKKNTTRTSMSRK